MQKVHAGMSPITGHLELAEIDDRRISLDRRTASNDRRGSPRKRIFKSGRTFWPNGDSIECAIRNLSETGAKLEVRSPVPNAFDLVIDCDRFRRHCRVIWRNASSVGVRFLEQNRPIQTPASLISRTSEFRHYAEVCRSLAQSCDILSREILLKMAEAWEVQSRRPRRKAVNR